MSSEKLQFKTPGMHKLSVSGFRRTCNKDNNSFNSSTKVNAYSVWNWSCGTVRTLTGNGIPEHAVTGGNFATPVGVQNISMTPSAIPVVKRALQTIDSHEARRVARAAARQMIRQGRGGKIVLPASSGATVMCDQLGAYCASKAGVNAFSDALMQEVRHEGIRVTVVLPGSVDTEFSGRTPDGSDWRLSPDDVAQTILGLFSHPPRSLPSRVEIRPARPPRKG